MGIDEDIDNTLNNIAYYAVIGFNRVLNITTPYLENTYKIYKSITAVFKPDNYVFFSGQDIPYSLKNVKDFKDISGTVFYNMTERSFYENPSKKLKNLPYLAATIKLNNEKICDLTDWISKIKYSTNEIPTIKKIVMAWSLESGVLLNVSKDYYAEVIDDNGDSLRIDFRNT